MAVRDQPRRGGVDVRIALEERRERPEQIGLVLLVVGDQRANRLVIEPPQLHRVVHVGQQQLVGPGLLVAELDPLGLALDHVGREQRFVAGAMQLERVLAPTATPDREGEPGQSGFKLAQDRRDGPASHLAVAVGH